MLANDLSEHCLWSLGVSLNGIAGSAISALKTNSAALGVVANNVANLNTQGYARRVVNLQTLAANGQLMGVDIASVQRITNQFFAQEQLSAGSAASQYDTMADLFDQLNGLLGGPGDNQSLATQLTSLAGAFATASQAPTASASRTGMMNALTNLAFLVAAWGMWRLLWAFLRRLQSFCCHSVRGHWMQRSVRYCPLGLILCGTC